MCRKVVSTGQNRQNPITATTVCSAPSPQFWSPPPRTVRFHTCLWLVGLSACSYKNFWMDFPKKEMDLERCLDPSREIVFFLFFFKGSNQSSTNSKHLTWGLLPRYVANCPCVFADQIKFFFNLFITFNIFCPSEKHHRPWRINMGAISSCSMNWQWHVCRETERDVCCYYVPLENALIHWFWCNPTN